jgi:hypothetical protein
VNTRDDTILQSLISRIEKMVGRVMEDGTKITYLGDGRNPGVTSVELLYFLKILQK